MSPPRERIWLRPVAGAAVLLLAVFAVSALDWDLHALADGEARSAAWDRFARFLGSFGAPNLAPDYLATAGHLALQTLSVAVLGTLLGALGGYLLALGASRAVLVGGRPAGGGVAWLRYLLRRGLCELLRLLLDVMRGVPDFAWAIVILALPGPGPVTGILALAVSVGGILGKIYSELWDNVPTGRYEAIRTTGAGRLVVFAYGIQPLAARSMLSFSLMRFECAVRNASVIGVVGGGGIGAQMFDEFNYGNFDNVVTLLLVMLVLTAGVDLFANFVRYRLRAAPAGEGAPSPLRGPLLRRLGGVGAGLALVVFCCLYLGGIFGGRSAERPPFQTALVELERVEWGLLGRDFARLLTPDLRWTQPLANGETKPGALQEALVGARVPLALGLLGTLLGTLIAALLAYPSAIAFHPRAPAYTGARLGPLRRALRWLTVLIARGLALGMRAIPEVAWLWIFATFFTLGVAPAICAMTLHTAGVLARVFTETVDDIPYRAYERDYLGSRPRLFLYGALPRSFRTWMSYAFFQFESNVRAGVTLGIIGVGGLGDSFDWSFKYWSLERASTFLLAMVLLTTIIDRVSRALRLERGSAR